MTGTISLNPLQDSLSRSMMSTTRTLRPSEAYGPVADDSDFDTLMAEHVAMHLDSGLDLSSDEACNLAAEAIQLEAEAYFVRNHAKGKGHSGFPPKQFEVSGQLSLQEKKARLQQLKSRTERRRCGQRGHWSGDAICPKSGKGNGKFRKPNPSSSTSTSTPSKGKKGKGAPKTRVVYFAMHDDGKSTKSPECNMAVHGTIPSSSSTPSSPLQPSGPSTLSGMPTLPSMPTLSRMTEPSRMTSSLSMPTDPQSLTQQLLSQGWTSDQILDFMIKGPGAASLKSLPQPEEPSAPPPSAPDQQALATWISQGPMDFGAQWIAETHTEVPSSNLALPVLAESGFIGQVLQTLAMETEDEGLSTFDDSFTQLTTPVASPLATQAGLAALPPSTPPRATTNVPMTTPMAANPPPGKAMPNVCAHLRTTKKGSNGYIDRESCLDCGAVLKSEKRAVQATSSKTTATGTSTCKHQRITWRGSNGFNWRNTCLDSGRVTKGSWNEQQGKGQSKGNFLPGAFQQPADGTIVYDNTETQELLKSTLLILTVRSQIDGAITTLDEVHRVLDAVATTMNADKLRASAASAAPTYQHAPATPAVTARSTGTSVRTPMSTPHRTTSHGSADDVSNQDHKRVNFGKYKNQTFIQALQDEDYVTWCINEVKPTSCRGMQDLAAYFRAKNNMPSQAFMAVAEDGPHDNDHPAKEHAVASRSLGLWLQSNMPWRSLDAKVHEGYRILCGQLSSATTFKGINGPVGTQGVVRRLEIGFELEGEHHDVAIGTLDSMELTGSDAPLLLSIQDQRRLQLSVDLSGDGPVKVHSKQLGGNLKVTEINGLLGIHLLPSHVALLGSMSGHDDSESATEVPDHSTPESPTSRYVDLEDEPRKTLTKGQKKNLKDDVEEVHQADLSMWSRLRGRRNAICLPRGCKTFLMEIFAGAAVLTSLAASLSLPVSARIDIKLDGSDLLKQSVRASIEKEIELTDPYIITFSPKCAPWGPWANLNMSKSYETQEKNLHEREDWYPFFQWMRKIVKQRLKRGRKVLIENPWTSAIWDTYSMRRLLSEDLYDSETNGYLELVRGDQCHFGLVDHGNGLPHKKPTGFMTASAEVKQRLNVLCDGQHFHQQLEGGSRTRRAEHWPEPLCKAILEGFIEELENRTFNAAFFNESLEEQGQEEEIHLGTLDLVQDDDDLSPQQDLLPTHLNQEELQRQELLEERPIAGDQEMELEKTRRSKWPRIPRPTRLALRRLHNMTGHSSSSNMIQLLRTAGATPAVVEACKHFACESCRKIQSTNKPNVTKIPGKPVFNNEVSLDCLEVRDAFGNRHAILSAVDLGTLSPMLVGHWRWCSKIQSLC